MEEKEIDKEVLEAVIKLFGGNQIEAMNWLNRPARALGGIKPIDASAEDVLLVINRLEHGIIQ